MFDAARAHDAAALGTSADAAAALHFQAGFLAQQIGRLGDALVRFEAALAIVPGHAQAARAAEEVRATALADADDRLERAALAAAEHEEREAEAGRRAEEAERARRAAACLLRKKLVEPTWISSLSTS